MNLRLLSKLLGIVSLLIGASMIVSMPWAIPALGRRASLPSPTGFEWSGFIALLISMLICFVVGGALRFIGRNAEGRLFRKEAMAVVGLSWILATVLGALPFYFAGVQRSSSLRLMGLDEQVQVFNFDGIAWQHWVNKPEMTSAQYRILTVLNEAGARGLNESDLKRELARYDLDQLFRQTYREARLSGHDVEWLLATLTQQLHKLDPAEIGREDLQEIIERELTSDVRKWTAQLDEIVDELISTGLLDGTDEQFAADVALLQRIKDLDEDWENIIIFPSQEDAPDDRKDHYRIRWVRMDISDCLFESQSGFSTTGATVISDLEDPVLVPHCILFWRSVTHFLGGLGIIVLFVVLLGQGALGKVLMRAEMPGPTKEGATARMQHTAWMFAALYCALNGVLAIILCLKMTFFDAICHAFGTMATGGFSTYNASLGHFNDPFVEYVVTLFMILAGTNFTLLYFVLLKQPGKLLADVEWQTYMAVIGGVTALIIVFGLQYDTFANFFDALRYGLFQVVAIITTTGFGTHDFDQWSSFGRGVLFLLMFVGGCAGSTGGGMKVIRHILFLKILRLEIEQSFHPRVVRPLKLGGRPVEDPGLRKNVLVYFGLILVIFVFSWLFVVTVEPDSTWGTASDHKLIDSASGIAATLNNIGPGLGTVGATQNYGHFSPVSKVLFVWLMMIGRLEIFSIFVLFVPSFWRNY